MREIVRRKRNHLSAPDKWALNKGKVTFTDLHFIVSRATDNDSTANILSKTEKCDIINEVAAQLCGFVAWNHEYITSRKYHIVKYRHVAQYIMREEVKASYTVIKNVMKKSNHSTILKTHESTQDLLDTKEKTVVEIYNQMIEVLKTKNIINGKNTNPSH